jgi:hypothetical protein
MRARLLTIVLTLTASILAENTVISSKKLKVEIEIATAIIEALESATSSITKQKAIRQMMEISKYRIHKTNLETLAENLAPEEKEKVLQQQYNLKQPKEKNIEIKAIKIEIEKESAIIEALRVLKSPIDGSLSLHVRRIIYEHERSLKKLILKSPIAETPRNSHRSI